MCDWCSEDWRPSPLFSGFKHCLPWFYFFTSCYYHFHFIVSHSGIIYEDFFDHFSVFTCCFHITNPQTECWTTSFNHHKIANLQEYLSDQLSTLSTITDANVASDKLVTSYTLGTNMLSTKRKCTIKTKAIKQWISSGILTLINTRTILFKEKNKNPTEKKIKLPMWNIEIV